MTNTILKTGGSLALAFAGAAACGVGGALAAATPASLFLAVPGLAAFVAGVTFLNRTAADEVGLVLGRENDALRAELERLQPPAPALPRELLETGDEMKARLELMGHAAADALNLLMAMRAQTVGVDVHVASVAAENEALRADNALLDHISGTVAGRGRWREPAPERPAFPDLEDRRGPIDFAPPAVRQARRSEVVGLRAIHDAIEKIPAAEPVR